MQEPRIPESEVRRIATLQSLHILDTASEERFDRVTRMARRIFDVPIALVSLVDENRQWFKSCVGLDASETPRDISFCGHAILDDEIFYIPNASADPRFADNPLVTDAPFIQFYAGHPLQTPNGEKMGTLCIIDTKPRRLKKDDLQALKDLAAMVEQELAALYLATQDELTLIPNRRGFMALARHSVNLSRRDQSPLCLAYFDLNNFKSINDQYGHASGDLALQLFAHTLEETLRDADIFGRLGGDEFVGLLTGADLAEADLIMTRFCQRLRERVSESSLAFDIEYSAGVVPFDAEQHDSIESLMISADQAMYADKHAQSS